MLERLDSLGQQVSWGKSQGSSKHTVDWNNTQKHSKEDGKSASCFTGAKDYNRHHLHALLFLYIFHIHSKQMSFPCQQIASTPPAKGISIKGAWVRIGVQINDELLGNHGNKQIHVKTQERLLIWAGEGFPKSRCDGSTDGAQASSTVMKQLDRQLWTPVTLIGTMRLGLLPRR